jgi:hypothetical protein
VQLQCRIGCCTVAGEHGVAQSYPEHGEGWTTTSRREGIHSSPCWLRRIKEAPITNGTSAWHAWDSAADTLASARSVTGRIIVSGVYQANTSHVQWATCEVGQGSSATKE